MRRKKPDMAFAPTGRISMMATVSAEPQSKSSRANLWLGGVVVVLLLAVVVLLVLLLRDGKPTSATALPLQGPSAAAHAPTPPDAGAGSPYVNLLDPKAPPGLAPSAPAPAQQPDPFAALLKGFGQGLDILLDDPDLKAAMKSLDKNIRKGKQLFGQLLGKRPGATPPSAQPPASGGPGGGALADLLGSLMQGLGVDVDEPARIEASVGDKGDRYEVVCRFPKGAPDTAVFEIKGEKLLVKAKFAGEEVTHEVDLPGPGHPVGARSTLRGGQLVISVPKAH